MKEAPARTAYFEEVVMEPVQEERKTKNARSTNLLQLGFNG